MKNEFFKITKRKVLLYGVFILGVLFSCSEDDPEAVVLGEFAMITSIQNEDGRNRAFFLQRVSVDSTGSVDNSRATELHPKTGAMIHSYKGSIYFSDYANGLMTKWNIDQSNNAGKAGEISLKELRYQGNTTFKDDSTAFIGGLSTSIIIFNPTTMTKTGTIDFSAVSKLGKPTDFPVKGGTYVGESVSEIIIRDNYLYAALMPASSLEGGNFQPAEIGCSIIVIDLDKVTTNEVGNKDAVIKRIYDERGSSTGAWGSGGGNYFMQKDENNDIYMLCHNFWANPFLRKNFKSACILKIANGETDFDKDYYFDVETVSKGKGNGVMNMEYYGNGKFLAAVQDPSAVDPKNPYSYFVDPIFQWWSFDLYSKTAKIVTKEYTKGAVAAVSYFEDGSGYIPFESKGENFVMKVNLETLETTKHFETTGLPQLYSLQ